MVRPDHVIVVMMENRGFDHLLGFLPHPDTTYEGATKAAGNATSPGGMLVRPNNSGDGSCHIGPNHEHDGVLKQLLGMTGTGPPYSPDNSGFVMEYEEFATNEHDMPGLGLDILKCIPPTRTTVLSTLALQFAVCDHWFCSVPGETWPNRNFAHAATSDGEVNIVFRPYFDTTIFEQLDKAKKGWAIYHDGVPQTLAFPKLWDIPLVRNHFKKMRRLFDAIEDDKLPHYAFVEPAHFGKSSNSQHPGNNQNSDNRDFVAGDALIGQIYEALRNSPRVFEKTLLVITYDEHGGYYDHVTPPTRKSLGTVKPFRKGDERFDFDLLGPRVPAVLVSPFIERGHIDHSEYDHASIPSTLRRLFGITDAPNDSRVSAVFITDALLTRSTPRTEAELPRFDDQPLAALAAVAPAGADALTRVASVDDTRSIATFDEFQVSLVELANQVDLRLRAEEAARLVGVSQLPPITAWSEQPQDALAAAAPQAIVAPAVYSASVVERLWASTPQTIRLRLPNGDRILAPTDAQIEVTLTATFSGGQAAEMWVADQEDRSVTVRGDGIATLRFPDDGVRLRRAGVSRAGAMEFVRLLRRGDTAALQASFGTPQPGR